MRGLDVINSVSALLDDKALTDYLRGKLTLVDDSSEEFRRATNLVTLMNFVINDLASNYISLTRIQSVTPTNGKYYISSLYGTMLEIKAVYDKDGNEIEYQLDDTYIYCEGAQRIEYQYVPTKYGFIDVFDFTEKEISVKCLVYGIASEYCMSIARFDEAIFWHEKHIEAIKISKKPTNRITKKRSWL